MNFLFIVLIFRAKVTFSRIKMIYQICHRWKATVDWNISTESILGTRRIKIERNKDKNLHLFYKILPNFNL